MEKKNKMPKFIYYDNDLIKSKEVEFQKRQMDMGQFFIIIILLGLLFTGSYFFLTLGGQENRQDEFFYSFEEQNASGGQFYPNMRYQDKEISYSISDSCSANKRAGAVEAFSIIDKATIIEFSEVSDNAEIKILCSNIAPKPDEETHFVAGEGGPSEIVNASAYSVILLGKVSLYRAESCDEPKVAVHEIFHALGFDHSNNPDDIMYPVTDCGQEVNPKLFEKIDELYSIDSAPDLVIEKSNASQSGRFLNFQMTIANFGLRDAGSAKLVVYADDEAVGEYELSGLGIGVRKIVKVENLRLPSGAQRIVFKVETDENEISKANNAVEMFTEE